MEAELGIPTCLFGGPPVLGDMIKMADSQQGFMNIFAAPLFSAVTKVLPGMDFSIKEMSKNKAIWEQKKAAVSARHLSETDSLRKDSHNDTSGMATPDARTDMTEGVGSSLGSQNKSLSDPEIFARRVADGHLTSTATALPLMQQLAAESSPSIMNGTNLSSPTRGSKTVPKGMKLFQKSTTSGSSVSNQRAASARQARSKTCPKVDSPLINGSTPSFAASETDVRYIRSKGDHNKNEHKPVHLSHHTEANSDDVGSTDGQKPKRLTQSFRKLWNRRWHSRSTQNLREDHSEQELSGNSQSIASPSSTTTSRETEKLDIGTS